MIHVFPCDELNVGGTCSVGEKRPQQGSAVERANGRQCELPCCARPLRLGVLYDDSITGDNNRNMSTFYYIRARASDESDHDYPPRPAAPSFDEQMG